MAADGDHKHLPARFQPTMFEESSLLTFNRASREADFISTATSTWIKVDTVIFTLATIIGPVKILSWKTPGLYKALLHHTWLIFSSVACSLMFLRAIRTRPEYYQQNRVVLLSVFRIFLAIGTSVIMHIEDPLDMWGAPTGGVLTVFLRIATKTSITPLWSSALGLQIPFKKHVWIHTFSTLLSALWIPNLCSACDLSDEFTRSTNELGWWTEWAIQKAVVLGFPVKKELPKEGEFPCLLVGLFYHVWLGFVLPTMGVYMVEIISRSKFLMHSLGGASSDCRVFRIGGLMVGGLYFLVGSQLLWFLLKGIVVGRAPYIETEFCGTK
ncbi:hypothetical protein BSKO_11039 [Bryopsis sp. KO-2023]|nr:hypothetical protein BSKO_11039 [Bryopsis sp. KO-2023]